MRKKIFISFDYDNDKNYRYLLSAFSSHPKFDIDFIDVTPAEIQSADISQVKGVLTSKIRSATHTLVVIGKYANSVHPDYQKIGDRNWQWWEINKSHQEGKSLIGIKIDSSNESPTPMLNKGAKWAHLFKVESIIAAINGA